MYPTINQLNNIKHLNPLKKKWLIKKKLFINIKNPKNPKKINNYHLKKDLWKNIKQVPKRLDPDNIMIIKSNLLIKLLIIVFLLIFDLVIIYKINLFQ